jgi:hypothetical protein
VLLAGQIASLTARWTGRQEPRGRVIAFLLGLLTFVVPVSSAYMGHHESLILLLVLLALRTHAPLAAGLCWGLALALKQTAAFAFLPVALLVLHDAWRAGKPGWPGPFRFFLPAVATPLLLILPFWLRWPAEVSYSLWGIESHRILYGVNLPHLLDGLAARFVPQLHPALNALLVRWTSPFFLLAAGVFSLDFVLRQRAARPTDPPRAAIWQRSAIRSALIAAIGANFAGFIVLGKWSDMHYQFMPLMLLLVLDLLERPDFPFVYVLFTLAATLFYTFAEPVSGLWRLAVFVVMAGYFLVRSLSRTQ